jgi:hypothetical protein
MKRPTKIALTAAVALAALVLAGCDREYVYQPTVTTTSAVAATTSSSAEALPGNVQLTTFGVEEVHPGGLEEARERTLHVRMKVENESDKTWFVDASEQLIALAGHGASRPAYATSDRGAAGTVPIPAGKSTSIELFYPLPAEMNDAKAIPSFETIWKLQTGSSVVSGRAAFTRVEMLAQKAPDVSYNAWGREFWYDSAGHRSLFVGTRIAQSYEDRPISSE